VEGSQKGGWIWEGKRVQKAWRAGEGWGEGKGRRDSIYGWGLSPPKLKCLATSLVCCVARTRLWRKLSTTSEQLAACNLVSFVLLSSSTLSSATTQQSHYQVQVVSRRQWNLFFTFWVFGVKYPQSLSLFYQFVERLVGVGCRSNSVVLRDLFHALDNAAVATDTEI